MKLRTPYLLFAAATASSLLDLIPDEFRSKVYFDHQVCISNVQRYLDWNTTTYKPLDQIFVRGPDGTLQMQRGSMVLKVPACNIICGNAKINWYEDRGPRIMTWIIPITLMLSNIELSPLDKRRFYTLIQALGDPADVLWSFVQHLAVGTQLYDFSFDLLARREVGDEVDLADPLHVRVVGTVLFALHDLMGPDFAGYQQLEDIVNYLDPGIQEIFAHWCDAALQLSDGRTDERLRSMFAILLYVVQLLSAFVFDIGGGSANPPG